MADTFLVLTVIGDDRPGLVGELSAAISAHAGNWLESSMAQLAGKFAGIVRVAVPPQQAAGLKAELEAMPQLRIVVETAGAESAPARTRRLTLSLVGHDRIGIVKEVTQVLARHGVNVEELDTHTASAPMSAETLFHAHAKLMAAAEMDVRALKADLERISNDLMVDVTLGEIV
jgi:glycine cleavage system regulatory protein